MFSRNFASTLVNRNKALSGSTSASNNENIQQLPNQQHQQQQQQQLPSPSKAPQMDSPASLSASFVKDQDGFDDVDAFFNQAVTPQKTPKAKAASVKATPSRTPLKANGLVAKPVAIISSKIAAHYLKEPRLAVSMSEVTMSQVEAELESLEHEHEHVQEQEEEELVESAMETVEQSSEQQPFQPTSNSNSFTNPVFDHHHQFQFDHDNDHDYHEDDALVNQMVEEMLVDPSEQLSSVDTTQTTTTSAKRNATLTSSTTKSSVKANKTPRIRRPAAYFPGAEFDENGVRRSRRQRMSPLRYWANEKVCYGRADDPSITLPVIVNVIKKPELDDPTFLAGKSTRTRQVNPNSLRLKAQAFGPHVEAEGYVRVLTEEGEETEEQRLLALSHHNVEGDPVKGNAFRIHTMFTEGSYMSAGQLLFPPGAAKPAKNSARHALVFYVIAGSFEVIVHETKFLIGPGGQFHVPRNNAYSIAHVSTDKAIEGRLFFCHCKDNREN